MSSTSTHTHDKSKTSTAHAAGNALRSETTSRVPLGELNKNIQRTSSTKRNKTNASSGSITNEMHKMHIGNQTNPVGRNFPRSEPGCSSRSQTVAESVPRKDEKKFMKVSVRYTKFNKRLRSGLEKSHMASTSSMPAVSSHNFIKSDAQGIGYRLSMDIKLGQNQGLGLTGVVDTGSSHFLVNEYSFKGYPGMNTEEDLANSLIDENMSVCTNFPSMNMWNLRGALYKSAVTLGREMRIRIEDQHFYVISNLNCDAVLGLGPPTNSGLVHHTIKDAPSLLESIVKYYGLPGIISCYNIWPWREDGDADTLRGSSIDFGGKDESQYDKRTLQYVRRSDHPSVENHYGIEATKVVYGKGKGMKTISPSSFKPQGILDSGAPGIMLSSPMFKDYFNGIVSDGVSVFYPEQGEPPFRTISIDTFHRLKPLTFHFKDINGKSLSVEIPAPGQVLPQAVGRSIGIRDDRLALAVSEVSQYDQYDFTLGIPFFQKRYVIFDLRREPGVIGFARTQFTDYISPEMKNIIDYYSAQDASQSEPEGEASSTAGKRKDGDGRDVRKKGESSRHRYRR